MYGNFSDSLASAHRVQFLAASRPCSFGSSIGEDDFRSNNYKIGVPAVVCTVGVLSG